jgi:hypothetical protein
MASLLEFNLVAATLVAESTRQAAKAAAFATWQTAGFTFATRAAYVAALVAADVAYQTAVNSASSTAGITFNGGYGAALPSNAWASIAT